MFTLAGGCKGKPTDHGAADDPAAPKSATDVGPPKKTTTPLTLTDYALLAQIQFPGYVQKVMQSDSLGLQIKYTTDTRPRVAALVIITPCTPTCIPMDLAK